MMDQQSTVFVPVVDAERCIACSAGIFSDPENESDNDNPEALLDHFLDKSRSVKEISCRPCYHGRLETPIISFNVAALQLSYDLSGSAKHIPTIIVFKDKCSPEDFYELVGCSRESKEILRNIIVFKFTPEDIEDEAPTENLYTHLVEKKTFAFAKLQCDLFSRLFALPLPKENEPPAFLPITSRVNLEPSPREDNVLLGVLVKKRPLEEGEISGDSSHPPVKDNSPISSDILSVDSPNLFDEPSSTTSKPTAPVNRGPSPATLEKAKLALEANFKLMPADRYGSYIGAPTEDIPFLTDPVASLETSAPTTTKPKPSTSSASTAVDKDTSFLESISSDSESELNSNFSKPTENRKRHLSTSSQVTSKMDKPVKLKQKRSSSSSSMPNLLTPSPSSSTSTTSVKASTSSSSTTTKHHHHSHKTSSSAEISKSSKGGSNSDPKKLKVSDNKIVDLESSDSDVDQNLFPRPLNHKMTGELVSSIGQFQFKYRVLKCDRTEVKKYLPTVLHVKARVNAPECERFLSYVNQKPNVKLILFQIVPRDTSEDKRIFENYVVHLVNRSRYGVVQYHPDTYRAYLLPYIKGKPESIGFEYLKLKLARQSDNELYGIVIKKSALAPDTPAETQTSGQRDKRAIESSEFPIPKSKNIFGPENFPDLDVNRLKHLIHSSIDDLISLSFNMSNILQKATENIPEERKLEATNEFTSKVLFIMSQEELQHAKRKKAYETVLSWLKSLGAS